MRAKTTAHHSKTLLSRRSTWNNPFDKCLHSNEWIILLSALVGDCWTHKMMTRVAKHVPRAWNTGSHCALSTSLQNVPRSPGK